MKPFDPLTLSEWLNTYDRLQEEMYRAGDSESLKVAAIMCSLRAAIAFLGEKDPEPLSQLFLAVSAIARNKVDSIDRLNSQAPS